MMELDLIAQKWTHAFEEDESAGATVFRPSDGKFPLSRGRDKMDLSNVGGTRMTIGADDRYKETNGRWLLSEDGKALTFTPEEKGMHAIDYDIVSLSVDRLVVKRRSSLSG